MIDEKKKFLEKCRENDREKLLGQKKMTFEDFERFLFLAETLEYFEYQKEIFDVFIPQFYSSYAQLQTVWEKEEGVWEETEEQVEKRKIWLEDFLKEAE